mgnify:FL=1
MAKATIHEDDSRPDVCKAVRAVGILKPKFNPAKATFDPPTIDVLGTGFWLKQEGLFVTCGHVISNLLSGPIDFTGMLVVGGNGFSYCRASVDVYDVMHDLAVLSMHLPDEQLKHQIDTGLIIADKNAEVADRVSYAGFPFGNMLLNNRHSPTYAEGIVGNDILGEQFLKQVQISGQVAHGFSGSPIVKISDPMKVIGVVANSPTEAIGQANIFRGISWQHLRAICNLARS